MDHKQKYTEVLNKARHAVTDFPNSALAQWLQDVFPELKESEDEKIRKKLRSLP